MTTRYVHATKGSNAGTFDTKASPARTITAALRVAAAGDVVEIMDNATYAEGELLINLALTLTSSYLVANPSADPTAATFAAANLPALTPRRGQPARCLRIAGTPATRSSFGPVTVRGLRISGGRAVHTPTEPALGAGGGVAIVDADKVLVDRCIVTGNSTTTAALSGWPESDRVALRDAIVDLVGTIISPTVEAALNALVTAANRILSMTAGTTLPLLNRTAVLIEVAHAFDGKLPSGRPNSWLAGQAFGGGIATVWASPVISRCLIRGNSAQGRGSGIGVVGYGWPVISDSWLDANHSGTAGRRDGGGIGCEVALPGLMPRNLSEIDLVRFLVSKLAAVKAVITSPTTSMSITDVIDYGRWLANPSLSPPVRGVVAIALDCLHAKFDIAVDHALYYFATSTLSLKKWEAWDSTEVGLAGSQQVSVSGCRITKNRSYDDGGGIYASVRSRVSMEKTTIDANVAETGMGGGARFSMGSSAVLRTCIITANTSQDRGGGLATRNCDLGLDSCQIGPVRPAATPEPVSNVCGDAPGGGFVIEVVSEGALAGIKDMWQSILREVFGVSTVTVKVASTTVRGNAAGFSATHAALGAPKSAKGGGLFIIRGDFPDAASLSVEFVNIAASVSDNRALTRGYLSKVTSAVVPKADQLLLQDLVGHKEITEDTWSSMTRAGALLFRQ